jgi:uncharacterized protein YggE
MTPTMAFGAQPEGVTVMGEASRNAAPEVVDVTLDVHAAGPTAAQALRENALKLMQIGQALTAAGVPQNEIESRAGTVYPLHNPSNPLLGAAGGLLPAGLGPYAPVAPPEFAAIGGYHVVSYLKLSVRDLSRLGDIVDSATRAGANLNAGFLFRLRDEPALRRALLEAAGRDARAKAETLAGALGRQLGDAASATEDVTSYYLGTPFPAMGGGMNQGAMGGPRFSPGELSFHARVNVTYRWQQ